MLFSSVFPSREQIARKRYFFNKGRRLTNDIFRDIYATAIVCAQLFPELYKVKLLPSLTRIIQIKTADLTPIEKAVINLVDAMTNQDLKVRCSSEEALNYCNELAKHAEDLNEATLEQIKNATIGNTTLTVEQVLRGVIRP